MSHVRASLALLLLLATGVIGAASGAPRKPRPKQPTPDQQAAAALQAQQLCEATCATNRTACTDDRALCDRASERCTAACFDAYLAALPAGQRAAVLQKLEDERRAAEAAAVAAAAAAEAAARAEAVARAAGFADQAEAAATQANHEAAAACAAASELSLPAPPCTATAAEQAATTARAAAARAASATDSQPAVIAAGEAEAALREAEQARDRAAQSKQDVAAEVAAEKQRRDDEIAARQVAWDRWLSDRNRLVGRVTKQGRGQHRRRIAWTALGVGGAAAVGAFLLYRAEQGRYDAIRSGDLATLEELESARDDAHLYNKAWIALGGVGAVGLAIGLPLLLRNLGGDSPPRLTVTASPGFGGVVWSGALP